MHKHITRLLACLLLLTPLAGLRGATITDVSNFDDQTVTIIDGDSTGQEVDSEAPGSTPRTELNNIMSSRFSDGNSYVISNWGNSTWSDDDTLQNVGGIMDIQLSHNDAGDFSPEDDTNFSSTGDSALKLGFLDRNVIITINFGSDVDAVGFVLANIGGAYNTDGGVDTSYYSGVDATGTLLSSQSFNSGGADSNSGDSFGGELYSGYNANGGTQIRSLQIDITRKNSAGDPNGTIGIDDFGFAVIPEPSTLLLGLVAIGAAAAFRRRR